MVVNVLAVECVRQCLVVRLARSQLPFRFLCARCNETRQLLLVVRFVNVLRNAIYANPPRRELPSTRRENAFNFRKITEERQDSTEYARITLAVTIPVSS